MTGSPTLTRLAAMVGVWLVLFAATSAWGRSITVPDFDRVEYGLPVVWVTNVRGTIAGPVDYFIFDWTGLLVDLVIWLAVGALLAYAFFFVRRRS